MNLVSIYERPDRHELLWRLLSERDASTNISHRSLPLFVDHEHFVDSRPYRSWFFIQIDDHVMGACYLTNNNEIGIQVFKDCQRRGYARQALELLMQENEPLPAIPSVRRGSFVANINPTNKTSQTLFENLGFRHIQNTYAIC